MITYTCAYSCSLEILPPSKVVQAVLDADVKCLLPSAANTADARAAPCTCAYARDLYNAD